MHILVLYAAAGKQRQNDEDYLYAFRKYAKAHTFYYLNVRWEQDLFPMLTEAPFDAVIFEHSFVGQRYDPANWKPLYEKLRGRLAALQGCKVLVPFDDYHYTDDLRRICEDTGVSLIFTPVRPDEYETYYPRQLAGGVACHTVHTGYVDNDGLALVKKRAREMPARDIDVGYRARKLYNGGAHGWLKVLLAQEFDRALKSRPQLRADVGNTGHIANAKMGQNWLDFLLRCRTMLGCLGGSSLLDVDGSVLAAIDAYVEKHPGASFDEVAAAAFGDADGKVHTFITGPRHYECAMTRTCQVLVEGDYDGVFQPDVHYIEVKRDFSNMDEVLEKIQDKAYCERMAQRCYDDIVGDGGADNPNTYAWFVNDMLQKIGAWQSAQRVGAGAGAAKDDYNWEQFAGRFARKKALGRLRQRGAAGVKKVKQAGQNTYYRLCEFSARHPSVQRLARLLRGETGKRDGETKNESE